MRAGRFLDVAFLVARRDDDGDARPRRLRWRERRERDAADQGDVDRKENQADDGEDGRGDDGPVEDGYDSGTFWRASARWG
jgi:hypothetical protein